VVVEIKSQLIVLKKVAQLLKALTAGGTAGSPADRTGGAVLQTESVDGIYPNPKETRFQYISCHNCGKEQPYLKYQVKCRGCGKNFPFDSLASHFLAKAANTQEDESSLPEDSTSTGGVSEEKAKEIKRKLIAHLTNHFVGTDDPEVLARDAHLVNELPEEMRGAIANKYLKHADPRVRHAFIKNAANQQELGDLQGHSDPHVAEVVNNRLQQLQEEQGQGHTVGSVLGDKGVQPDIAPGVEVYDANDPDRPQPKKTYTSPKPVALSHAASTQADPAKAPDSRAAREQASAQTPGEDYAPGRMAVTGPSSVSASPNPDQPLGTEVARDALAEPSTSRVNLDQSRFGHHRVDRLVDSLGSDGILNRHMLAHRAMLKKLASVDPGDLSEAHLKGVSGAIHRRMLELAAGAEPESDGSIHSTIDHDAPHRQWINDLTLDDQHRQGLEAFGEALKNTDHDDEAHAKATGSLVNLLRARYGKGVADYSSELNKEKAAREQAEAAENKKSMTRPEGEEKRTIVDDGKDKRNKREPYVYDKDESGGSKRRLENVVKSFGTTLDYLKGSPEYDKDPITNTGSGGPFYLGSQGDVHHFAHPSPHGAHDVGSATQHDRYSAHVLDTAPAPTVLGPGGVTSHRMPVPKGWESMDAVEDAVDELKSSDEFRAMSPEQQEQAIKDEKMDALTEHLDSKHSKPGDSFIQSYINGKPSAIYMVKHRGSDAFDKETGKYKKREETKHGVVTPEQIDTLNARREAKHRANHAERVKDYMKKGLSGDALERAIASSEEYMNRGIEGSKIKYETPHFHHESEEFLTHQPAIEHVLFGRDEGGKRDDKDALVGSGIFKDYFHNRMPLDWSQTNKQEWQVINPTWNIPDADRQVMLAGGPGAGREVPVLPMTSRRGGWSPSSAELNVASSERNQRRQEQPVGQAWASAATIEAAKHANLSNPLASDYVGSIASARDLSVDSKTAIQKAHDEHKHRLRQHEADHQARVRKLRTAIGSGSDLESLIENSAMKRDQAIGDSKKKRDAEISEHTKNALAGWSQQDFEEASADSRSGRRIAESNQHARGAINALKASDSYKGLSPEAQKKAERDTWINAIAEHANMTSSAPRAVRTGELGEDIKVRGTSGKVEVTRRTPVSSVLPRGATAPTADDIQRQVPKSAKASERSDLSRQASQIIKQNEPKKS
jgi:hypothetical protein